MQSIISFRIDPADRETLEALAARADRKLSDYVRIIVLRELRQIEKGKSC